MEKIKKIIRHHDFIMHLSNINRCEQTREFCKHGIEHVLAVARIAWTLVLEAQKVVPIAAVGGIKEKVYAASLLHDIGRAVEYTTGEPHEVASARLAQPILQACGFNDVAIQEIIKAIVSHRDKKVLQNKDSLEAVVYQADKLSRNCFICSAQHMCHRKDKNVELLC